MPLLAALMLAGCGTYVPSGSTVIALKGSKVELDRADLRPPDNELNRSPVIPMKWYDSNTFITTAPLAPGIYSFRARNFNGNGFVHNVEITADKHLYEIDEKTRGPVAEVQAEGPAVKGHVTFDNRNQATRSVSVLFIGKQIVMKTVELAKDGGFTVNAPAKGKWKIELYALGDNPAGHSTALMSIDNPVDIGTVSLR